MAICWATGVLEVGNENEHKDYSVVDANSGRHLRVHAGGNVCRCKCFCAQKRRLAALKKAQEEAAKQKTGDENKAAKNIDAAGQTLQKAEDAGAVKKHENLDEDLML